MQAHTHRDLGYPVTIGLIGYMQVNVMGQMELIGQNTSKSKSFCEIQIVSTNKIIYAEPTFAKAPPAASYGWKKKGFIDLFVRSFIHFIP